MDDAVELAGSVSTYSTASECLNMKDVIKQRLRDLIERPFDTTPHDNADIKVPDVIWLLKLKESVLDLL